MKKLPLSHIYPIIGIILAVAWNIPHLVSVYAETVGEEPNFYHYAMMVIIEFSVLVFALKKYEYAASTFAVIIFFLNLYFYFDFITNPIDFSWSYLWFSFSRILFSAIPAYLIAYYSQMFANTFTEDWMDDRQRLEKVSDELETVRDQLEKDSKELEDLRKVLRSVREAKGYAITINKVKATICQCDNLIVAGSNREGTRVCECGNLIEW